MHRCSIEETALHGLRFNSLDLQLQIGTPTFHSGLEIPKFYHYDQVSKLAGFYYLRLK